MNKNTGPVHVLATALGALKGLSDTVQVARPPLCPPLLSQRLLGWLVKSVSISGREHVCMCVCVGAPRAHAN